MPTIADLPIHVTSSAGVYTAAGVWTVAAILTANLVKPFLSYLGKRGELANESTKITLAAEAQLRADLVEMVDKVRREQADERLRCANQIAEMRIEHAQQIALHKQQSAEERSELQGQIKGLRDQLLQMQSTLGVPIQFVGRAPTAEASIPRVDAINKKRRQAAARRPRARTPKADS